MTIHTEVADLTTWTWPTARFNVIASIFFHLPPLERQFIHANFVQALAPGGLLLSEDFAALECLELHWPRWYMEYSANQPSDSFHIF